MAPPPPPTDEEFRQSEEKFRLLVASIRDYAIFLLGPDGRVQSWNAGAQAIKGYTANEIIGKHIEVFYTPADRAAGRPQRLLSEAAAMGRVEDEGPRLRKDGTTFWADVVITVLKDAVGRVIGFAKVTRDLTERRRGEQARLELAQAQEAMRLRDDFLAMASHELKTPLTSLQLVLAGLERQVEEPALAARFKRAVDSAMRLAALIDSLLDASAMAGGRLLHGRSSRATAAPSPPKRRPAAARCWWCASIQRRQKLAHWPLDSADLLEPLGYRLRVKTMHAALADEQEFVETFLDEARLAEGHCGYLRRRRPRAVSPVDGDARRQHRRRGRARGPKAPRSRSDLVPATRRARATSKRSG